MNCLRFQRFLAEESFSAKRRSIPTPFRFHDSGLEPLQILLTGLEPRSLSASGNRYSIKGAIIPTRHRLSEVLERPILASPWLTCLYNRSNRWHSLFGLPLRGRTGQICLRRKPVQFSGCQFSLVATFPVRGGRGLLCGLLLDAQHPGRLEYSLTRLLQH